MQTITTIGLDIAKSVFQIHGVDGGRSSGHPPVSLNANAALIMERRIRRSRLQWLGR